MNHFNQHWNNQLNNQSQQTQEQPNLQTQPNNQVNQQPSWLIQLAGACLPVLLKQFTGQDLAQSSPSSNNVEIPMMLSQVLAQQQLIINSQQALDQRLANLENNATHQFTNLVQQVQSIKSIRLSQEKKQIDFNLQSENEPNKY